MGACFVTVKAYADDPKVAKTICENYIEQHQYEYGHGGYTGTFAEAKGVCIESMVFSHYEDAFLWLEDNAEKWGPAIGVLVREEDNEPYYMFGAWCSE
jgi:hypothetical protein